jgi:hypothetical protein
MNVVTLTEFYLARIWRLLDQIEFAQKTGDVLTTRRLWCEFIRQYREYSVQAARLEKERRSA